jgi:hypothetical protein
VGGWFFFKAVGFGFGVGEVGMECIFIGAVVCKSKEVFGAFCSVLLLLEKYDVIL